MKSMSCVGRVYRYVCEKERDQTDQNFSEWFLLTYGEPVQSHFSEYALAFHSEIASINGMLKYDVLQPDVDLEVWGETLTWAEKHFMCMTNSAIWDEDMAIAELDKSKSPGIPFNNWFKTKKEFFNWPLSNEFLDEYYEELAGETCRGVLWNNVVKQEVRLVEKIERPRVICAASVEHTYACNRVFGDMNQSFYESGSRQENWSFVGATKFRRGWDTLGNRLDRHPNKFEVDESAYDSSLFREAMWGMAEFRYRMLSPLHRTPENYNRIINLYQEIVNSVMVGPMGDLLMKNTGNPSGSSNTIVDNTIILYRLFCYAWIKLAPDYLCDQRSMHDHVEAALNGDDNTWSCSDEVLPWFNAQSVSMVWSDLGIKAQIGNSSKLLDDCYFLSAKFFKVDGVYVPLPDWSRVMSCMCYNVRDPKSVKWSFLRACALRIELFWDGNYRPMLDNYIKWLLKRRLAQLKAPKNEFDPLDWFTFEELMAVYKTDSEICALYLTPENTQPVIKKSEYKNEMFKRLKEFVSPSEWDKHVNSERGVAMQARLEERPWRWMPDYIRYPYGIAEALIKDYEPEAPAIIDSSAIKEMPPKKKSKSQKSRKGSRKGRARSQSRGRGRGRPRGGGQARYGSAARPAPGRPSQKYNGIRSRLRFDQLAPSAQKRMSSEMKSSVNSGNTISFRSRRPGSLIISGRQRVGTLKWMNVPHPITGTTGVTTQICMAYDVGGTYTPFTWENGFFIDTITPLNPSLPGYFNAPLYSFALQFQRFRWLGMTLEFDTQLPTTATGKLMISYADDPTYLDRQGYTGPLLNQVPQILDPDIINLAGTKTKTLYDNWTWRVPIDTRGDRFYINNEYDPYNAQHYVIDNLPDNAEDRQCFKGIINYSGYVTGTVTLPLTIGDMYMRYSIELSDIGCLPDTSDGPFPTPLLTRSEKKMFKMMEQMRMLDSKVSSGDLKSILKKPGHVVELQDVKVKLDGEVMFPPISVVEHKVDAHSVHNMLATVDAQEAAPGPVHETGVLDRVSDDEDSAEDWHKFQS